MQIDASRPARRTGRDRRSASEKATTNGTSRSRQARIMRRAISPRLAISTFWTMSYHDHAAVDPDYLPSKVGGIVARQIGHGAGDIFCRAGSPHRNLVEHPL